MFRELIDIWRTHKVRLTATTLQKLFNDPQRFNDLSRKTDNLLYDFSKQLIDKQLVNASIMYLQNSNLQEKITDLFAGKFINQTENRKVWHTELRNPNPELEIKATLQRIQDLTNKVHNKEYLSATNQPFTNIVNVGIGGSDLGIRLVHKALANTEALPIHFLTNLDQKTTQSLLDTLNKAQTLCIISSKSFTTPETLLNFKILINAFAQELGKDHIRHFIIVTANTSAPELKEFPIDQVFPLWSFVGGRFSISSAVGLPIALSLGFKEFNNLLCGLHAMDTHFKDAKFSDNLPILMAIIGIWNINMLEINNLAILPYSDSLEYLPAYLQQLEMESNGKSVDVKDSPIPYHTSPIIWGGVGCNCQHSFFQALHQGSHKSALDFILPLNGNTEQQQLLYASCIAQTQALMLGKTNPSINAKTCPGNKPTSTIIINQLTSFTLGQLIALYEHKVFIQGILWEINSFDQWGVELGKTLTNAMLTALQSTDYKDLDPSSKGLLSHINAFM